SEFAVAREAVFPRALAAALSTSRAITRLPAERFAAEGALPSLSDRFGARAVAWLAGPAPEPLATRAAAAALAYLADVQGSALAQMRAPVRLERRMHLGLD